MASITLTGSFDPMRQSLKSVADIGRDPQAVLQAVGHIVLNSTRDRIRRQVQPDGSAFAPLNPVYALTKEGPGILRGPNFQNGLYGSLTAKATGNVLRWGSNKVYARVHQFGAVIQPKNKRQLSFEMGGRLFHVDSVFVPARPYLAFTPQDREDVVVELEGFLERAIKSK
ncbi:phage virion morphogenesis protein [Neokomagataea anthophila]|uniref:Phage virion morphogenesis protein n=1 Tax=Neokomagataea anthophila TaxID=2826925 RepID=A0ABS5E6M4_9PROT|nr:phage virion morphogenesis protein [Neokomagataea anthophila]MBR0559506.1 phage virion morphogenesis protein [Neokomagataea anthophila]